MWQADDLLRAAVERTRPYAQWMSLELVWQDKLDSDLVVEADSRRIGHVLTNPLANAVKLVLQADGSKSVLGQSAAGVNYVFRTQASAFSPTSSFAYSNAPTNGPVASRAGMGLGLAICKHLVQAHGGAIWAENGTGGPGAT